MASATQYINQQISLLNVSSVPRKMFSVDYYSVALAIPGLIFLAHFIPWLVDPRGVKGYPGPFLAKFSYLWLGYVSKMGHRSDSVHKAHKKYGVYRFSLLASNSLTWPRNRHYRSHCSQPHLRRRPRGPEFHLWTRKRCFKI